MLRIDSIIIGIGININNKESDFPKEIKDIATSIFMETGNEVNRAELAAALVEEIDIMRSDWSSGKASYTKAYRDADITCGRKINVISGDKIVSAKAISINDDFSLKVKYSNGRTADISSGEVSIKWDSSGV